MPKKCSVCQHAELGTINGQLVAGIAAAKISALFGVSADAIQRHKAKHLPVLLKKAHEAKEVTAAGGLLARVQELEDDSRRIAEAAEKKGDLRGALAGVRERTRLVELLARLRVELARPEGLRLQLPSVEGAQTLPQAAAAILQAAAEGKLSPDEASRLVGILRDQAAIIETSELEARVRELEERLTKHGQVANCANE